MTAIPEDIMQAARELARSIAIHHSDQERIEAIARALMAAEDRQRERADRLERKVAARDRRIARLVEALNYARAQGVRFPADEEPHVVLSTAIRSQNGGDQ